MNSAQGSLQSLPSVVSVAVYTHSGLHPVVEVTSTMYTETIYYDLGDFQLATQTHGISMSVCTHMCVGMCVHKF